MYTKRRSLHSYTAAQTDSKGDTQCEAGPAAPFILYLRLAPLLACAPLADGAAAASGAPFAAAAPFWEAAAAAPCKVHILSPGRLPSALVHPPILSLGVLL